MATYYYKPFWSTGGDHYTWMTRMKVTVTMEMAQETGEVVTIIFLYLDTPL